MSRPEKKYTQVPVDAHAIERMRKSLGIPLSVLQTRGIIHRHTYASMMDSGEVRIDCFDGLVEAFGAKRDDLLAAPLPAKQRPESQYAFPSTEEWEVDRSSRPTEWRKAANGLQYRIFRMRHRTIADHFGRGKFYDLLGVQKRDELKHQLERHAVVGMTVGPNPNVSQLYSCVPAGNGASWWVIDRWIEGSTLEYCLQNGPLPQSDLPRLMKEILNGLAAVHSHDIVLREMTPGRVLIPEGKGPPVLTDFEMAKLFNGAPTVKNGVWPENPYRAPEVDSGQVAPSADLFSWAVILLHAATGTVPDEKRLKEMLVSAKLPAQVTEVVQKCLSSSPSRRPQDCETVRRALGKWS